MRRRFVDQLAFGGLPIGDTPINPKSKNSLDELLSALLALFNNKPYLEKLMCLLENHLTAGKKKTGKKGMDLWSIFVLAQVRLCLNLTYNNLHNYANNHATLRHLLGIETTWGLNRIQFEYQHIYDNVNLLNAKLLQQINELIVEFGRGEIFKKKETAALRLKSDSFVVESNVHFPTDYNLLCDCSRVCVRQIIKLTKKYEQIAGWRKAKNWTMRIKNLARNLGKVSKGGGKNKAERQQQAAINLLNLADKLVDKIEESLPAFPKEDFRDWLTIDILLEYKRLLIKHIDLVDRRILQGEEIPHEEKMFSVFERYTEWINKGKRFVELGKQVCITTDENHLIVDYQIMKKQQDSSIIPDLIQRICKKYKINSWSFDKGFWSLSNKELLEEVVEQTLVLPKKGKRNKAEEALESSRDFKRLRKKHSAVESNINELEHRGLGRCLDRGEHHFDRYIALGVSAYNLKKIGRKLLTDKRKKLKAEAKKGKQLLAKAA